MKKTLFAGIAGTSVALAASGAMAQTFSTDPVGNMLSQVDTTSIQGDIAIFGVAAVGIFLTIAAIALAKKLLSKTTG